MPLFNYNNEICFIVTRKNLPGFCAGVFLVITPSLGAPSEKTELSNLSKAHHNMCGSLYTSPCRRVPASFCTIKTFYSYILMFYYICSLYGL